jgi:ATP adenylyltransferase|tara:strand:- start:101 stop:598 length:498 start_codon:yes stop_codon:yes gene_type:complete
MDKNFLWAPWRMDYIQNPNKEQDVFLKKIKSSDDRKHLVLHRSVNSFVVMNLYPYNNGHLMVVPYEKYDDMTKLNVDTLSEIMSLSKDSMKILKDKLHCEGFNFGLNMGKAAGAGIDDHLHFHIVPRWMGDSNFMPVTGHTKIIMENLFDTYDKLKPSFDLLKKL